MRGFTLDVDVTSRGPVLGVFGASGSGKTTFLHAIMGLVRTDAGEVTVLGRTLSRTPDGPWVAPERRRIGLVTQDPLLFPHLSVERNLVYAPRARAVLTSARGREIVDVLRITPLLARGTVNLSGGEKQRVALARALLAEPDLLLLDEPVSALDAELGREVLLLLLELKRRLAVPMVFVTHRAGELLALADDCIVLDAGKVVAQGPPLELLARPRALGVASLVGVDNLLRLPVVAHDERGGVTLLGLGDGQELAAPLADAGARRDRERRLLRRRGDALSGAPARLECAQCTASADPAPRYGGARGACGARHRAGPHARATHSGGRVGASTRAGHEAHRAHQDFRHPLARIKGSDEDRTASPRHGPRPRPREDSQLVASHRCGPVLDARRRRAHQFSEPRSDGDLVGSRGGDRARAARVRSDRAADALAGAHRETSRHARRTLERSRVSSASASVVARKIIKPSAPSTTAVCSLRLEDAVATMRRAWAGEVMGEGILGPVGPKPLQPGGPEIMLGALFPQSIRRGARFADGISAFSFGPTFEDVAEKFELARTAWREAKRPKPPRLATGFWFALGRDGREQMGVYLERYLKFMGESAGRNLLPHCTAISPEGVREALKICRDAGAEEVVLSPTTTDPDEVHRLADLIG